jgi:Rrf2 family protein
MTFMAAQPTGKLSGAREIAAREHIPAAFLWKILHALARKKLIRSFKGVRGGYELARPARRISLTHVILAMESPKALQRCLLGFPECGARKPCPLYPLEQKLKSTLRTMTFADVVRSPDRGPNQAASRKPRKSAV